MAQQNSGGTGVNEILNYTVVQDGIYYVKVRHADSATFGAGTEYDLEAYDPIMPSVYGIVSGIVTDSSTSSPIAGIPVSTSAGYSDLTDANGMYIIFHLSGTYEINVTNVAGYYSYAGSFTINGSESITKHLALDPLCVDNDGDGYSTCAGDCNDSNPAVHPGVLWYMDSDGDSYGNSSVAQPQCSQPAGYVSDSNDCNDNDSNIYPNGPPARLLTQGVPVSYHWSVLDAYSAASSGDTIECKNTSLIDTLMFNQTKTVSLEGGYNCDFTSNAGITHIQGNIIIESGSISFENITLE